MRSAGLHHVSFSVRDLERSKAFYGGLLGFESIPRPDLGIPGIWYRVGKAELHLIAQVQPAPEPGPGALSPLANHAAFAIADYQEVLDELLAQGFDVVPTSPAQGQLWVQDPDGNVIEFIVPRAGPGAPGA